MSLPLSSVTQEEVQPHIDVALDRTLNYETYVAAACSAVPWSNVCRCDRLDHCFAQLSGLLPLAIVCSSPADDFLSSDPY